MYPAVHGMHGATCYPRWFGWIVLEGRIYQGAPWIHDTRHAISPDVYISRVVQSKGMTVFMRSRGRTVIKVFQLEITGIAAQPVHEGNIAVNKALDAEKIISWVGILKYFQFGDAGP